MGRLMDSILTAVGMKPSDRDIVIQPLNQSMIRKDHTDTPVPVAKTATESPATSDNSTGSTLDQHIAKTDEVVKPEDESVKDCFSCKAVGTITMMSTAGIVLYWTFRNAPLHLDKRKRLMLYGQGISLSLLFTTLAVSRAFDIGLFDVTKRDEPISSRIQEDFRDLANFYGFDVKTSSQTITTEPTK